MRPVLATSRTSFSMSRGSFIFECESDVQKNRNQNCETLSLMCDGESNFGFHSSVTYCYWHLFTL